MYSILHGDKMRLHQATIVNFYTSQVPIDSFFRLPMSTKAAALRKVAKNETSWSFIDTHKYSSELKRIRQTNFRLMWEGHDFVSVHLNGAVWNHFVMNDHLVEAGDRYSLNRFSKRQLFEVVLKFFFSSPMPALKTFVLGTLQEMQGTYNVGVQMRFGGRWGDGKRYNGNTSTIASCFISKTLSTCWASACSTNCSVFLTTDNTEAAHIFTRALMPHNINVYMSSGDTIHSEKSGGDQTQHKKTFGDWYLLTKMSSLVISRSGFSETASWFGNVPSSALTKASTCLFYEEGTDIPDGAEYFDQE